MRGHERAPGTGSAGGGDQGDTGSDSIVRSPADIPLHTRLLDAGIPVVVCRPHRHRDKCTDDCEQELSPPAGWSRMTVAEARQQIGRYRPGVDTLAMVGGHGIDVLDIDYKAGGEYDAVPPGLRRWGCTVTPSGGWHFPVPSTGYGKGDLFIDGVYQGDYVGGTALGGSRLLCFLPGSTRPKYPGKTYTETQPWDVTALVASDPPPELLGLCETSALSMTGTPCKPAATPAQVSDFVAVHTAGDPYQLSAANCGYGHAAITRIVDEVAMVAPGDRTRGRHMWAIRSLRRVAELVEAGCLTSQSLQVLEANFLAMKPGGHTEWDSLVAFAVANASPNTKCEVHSG